MPAAFFPCVILHGAGAFYPSSGGRDRRRGGKARRGQRARGSDENCGSSRCRLCRIQAGDHGRGTQVGKLRVAPAGEATGPRRRSHCEGRREAPRGPPGGEQTLRRVTSCRVAAPSDTHRAALARRSLSGEGSASPSGASPLVPGPWKN